MAASGDVRVGCSGWNYKAWRGPFYPSDLPHAAWLGRYASVFDTVEINNTFYRLPEASTFAGWRDQTASGFCFAVKASRFLTHLKRLKDPAEPIARLMSRAQALGSRLGPMLYQLPPMLRIDLARLEAFLDLLPRDLPATDVGPAVPSVRHVLEFRDPSWYVDAIFKRLDAHGVALCLHDKRGSAIGEPVVGPFTYVRFHGTSGHYQGSYGRRALEAWARRLADERDRGRDVYAYFNNDPAAAAPENALELRRLLTQP